MENQLISVIVPVYNVEQYLEKCVQSIMEQSYSNLQIILVDDGSTDQSGNICDKLARQDQRIFVIHQVNQGVVSARKSAIESATGEYICFVDGDDYISNDMIENLYAKIGDSDLISSGCYRQDKKGGWMELFDNFEEDIYVGSDAINYILSNMIIFHGQFKDGLLPYLGTKMYRSGILKQEIQTVNMNLKYSEDRDLLFRYILQCKKIRVLHKAFYFYFYREHSAAHGNNLNYLSNLNELYLSLTEAFQNHSLEYILMYQLQMFVISQAYYLPYRMGFLSEVKQMRFLLPYPDMEGKMKIVLYGAGHVGMNYRFQLQRRADFQLVLWVDQSWQSFREKGFAVESPAKISEVEYDQIILAVKDKSVAEDINNELLEHGIPKEKIVWEQPIIFSY